MCIDGKLIDKSNWKVDYTNTRSLNNWMTEHKLYCESRFYIGLFGSMYFIGEVFSGLLLKLSDHYGSVFIIQIVALFQVVLTLLMNIVQDYHYYYVLYFYDWCFGSQANLSLHLCK